MYRCHPHKITVHYSALQNEAENKQGLYRKWSVHTLTSERPSNLFCLLEKEGLYSQRCFPQYSRNADLLNKVLNRKKRTVWLYLEMGGTWIIKFWPKWKLLLSDVIHCNSGCTHKLAYLVFCQFITPQGCFIIHLSTCIHRDHNSTGVARTHNNRQKMHRKIQQDEVAVNDVSLKQVGGFHKCILQ